MDFTEHLTEDHIAMISRQAMFFVATAPLAGADLATTLRHVDGRLQVTDGPFAETAEAIAGYYDVELPDLDSAIAAGSLLPSPFSIEIRPVETVGA